MEAPPNPMPFEYGEGDKDKKEKGDKKKKTLRIPLPASEVHTSEPKSFERLLPLFEKKDEGASKVDNDKTGLADRDIRPSPFAPSVPEAIVQDQPGQTAETTSEDDVVTPHEDLSEIHDTLWSEFDSADTQAAIHEPSHAERTTGATVAGTEDEHQSADDSVPAPETPAAIPPENNEHEHRIDHGELTIPAPEVTHHDVGQEHAIDLNVPVEHTHELRKPVRATEDAMPPAPSVAGMNAEVAATEPDQESVRLWEEFDAAPKASAPEWHPESKPLDTNEQFSDIMQRADMDKQFISETSDTAVPARPQPIPVYGSFNTTAPTSTETTPYMPTALASERTNVISATGNEGPAWYPPRRNGMSGGSLLRSAAEAGVVGGALAGAGAAASAAHAAETGGLLAGGAAGAIAGGVAGHAAGEHAARQNVSQELQQAQQQAELTRIQHEQQIAALANEHRTAQEHISRLTQDNQRLAKQQRPVEAPAPVTSPVEATKPEQEADNIKTAHSEWVDMAVDKRTGQLAEGPGVNEFGREYYAEQRAETMPTAADPLTIALAAAKAAARTATEVTDAYEQEHGQPMQHGYAAAPPPPADAPPLPSGQITEQSYELPAGPQPVDYSHRLAAPQSQAMAILSNPLVWAGVAVLVLAFLAAVFI